ncbi:MAG: hypothetical protein K1X36_12965 [Pyrinomonadaceae bacterium]|nr:hypothetical protein [Pyrinomonadaceae bacterium]
MKTKSLTVVFVAIAVFSLLAMKVPNVSAQSNACKVTMDNAEFFYSSSGKVVKLKKGTELRIVVFGGQGVVVVKAKIGKKWIKGEIKIDDTSCE